MGKFEKAIIEVNEILKAHGIGAGICFFDFDQGATYLHMPTDSAIQFLDAQHVVIDDDKPKEVKESYELLQKVPLLFEQGYNFTHEMIEVVGSFRNIGADSPDETSEPNEPKDKTPDHLN